MDTPEASKSSPLRGVQLLRCCNLKMILGVPWLDSRKRTRSTVGSYPWNLAKFGLPLSTAFSHPRPEVVGSKPLRCDSETSGVEPSPVKQKGQINEPMSSAVSSHSCCPRVRSNWANRHALPTRRSNGYRGVMYARGTQGKHPGLAFVRFQARGKNMFVHP